MKNRCCVYISMPDPEYEHDNYIKCSLTDTHVPRYECAFCKSYFSLSDAITALDNAIRLEKERFNHDNQEST